MKEQLIDNIQLLVENKKNFQKDLKNYVQDKSLPLSDRWEVFCLAKDFLPTRTYLVRFETEGVNKYISNNYSRYEEIDLIDLIESFEEEDNVVTIDINKFREEVLDGFICGFYYDW